MRRSILKFLFLLVVLAAVGIAGYAYLGDLSPSPTAQSVTVTLDAQ